MDLPSERRDKVNVVFGKGQYPLVAIVPEFSGSDVPAAYWIVCRTRVRSDGRQEYVLAWVRELSAEEWGSGFYSTDLAEVMRKLYTHAGMQHMPWNEIAQAS